MFSIFFWGLSGHGCTRKYTRGKGSQARAPIRIAHTHNSHIHSQRGLLCMRPYNENSQAHGLATEAHQCVHWEQRLAHMCTCDKGSHACALTTGLTRTRTYNEGSNACALTRRTHMHTYLQQGLTRMRTSNEGAHTRALTR